MRPAYRVLQIFFKKAGKIRINSVPKKEKKSMKNPDTQGI